MVSAVAAVVDVGGRSVAPLTVFDRCASVAVAAEHCLPTLLPVRWQFCAPEAGDPVAWH
jgi:hypothetical protein